MSIVLCKQDGDGYCQVTLGFLTQAEFAYGVVNCFFSFYLSVNYGIEALFSRRL